MWSTEGPSGWWGIVIGGGALLWNIFDAISERRARVVVRQIGDSLTDRAQAISEGGVIYMLRVAISNESTKKSVTLAHFRLLLPWKDEYLDLLTDPKDLGGSDYVIPPGSDSPWRYPRDMILNHRVYSEGKLAPGDFLEGGLLFKGAEPIPTNLPAGEEIEVKLKVVLNHGKPAFAKCLMMLANKPRWQSEEPSGEQLLQERANKSSSVG